MVTTATTYVRLSPHGKIYFLQATLKKARFEFLQLNLTQLSELKKCSIFSRNYKIGLKKLHFQEMI